MSDHTASATGADQLALLETGELELVGRLFDASNATFLARVATPAAPLDGGVGVRCVYKPIRGERPLDDFPRGTLAHRERAAFLLSEATGWRIVPATVLRDGPLGRGMVQLWIDVDPTSDVLAMLAAADPRLRRVAVFDVLVNNADRKGGHLLPVADEHIYGVDHGICFAEQPKLRTVLWAWRGQPLMADELAVVERVAGALRAELGEALAELLSPAEVAATVRRTAALLREARFPQPDPYRPAVPWPPL